MSDNQTAVAFAATVDNVVAAGTNVVVGAVVVEANGLVGEPEQGNDDRLKNE